MFRYRNTFQSRKIKSMRVRKLPITRNREFYKFLFLSALDHYFMDHVTVDIGQATVDAVLAIGSLFVVDA